MTLKQLENLVKTKNLKREPPDQKEFDNLLNSGRNRLTDAQKHALSFESRFDLAYNASHAFSLAALRWHGYRPDKRYMVFQCLPPTLGLGPEVCRVLDKCHEQSNITEYQGNLEIEEQLLIDLIVAAKYVLESVSNLGPVPENK